MVLIQQPVAIVIEGELLTSLDISGSIQRYVIISIAEFCGRGQILTPIIAVVNESGFIAFIAGIYRSLDFPGVRGVEVVEREISNHVLSDFIQSIADIFSTINSD